MNLLTRRKSVLAGLRSDGKCLQISPWTVLMALGLELLFTFNDGVLKLYFTYVSINSFLPASSATTWIKFINNRIMLQLTSSCVDVTRRTKSWSKMVGKKFITELMCMAWAALRTLHVSLSDGIGRRVASSNFSACAKRLWRCWSVDKTVESRRKLRLNIGFWLSIHWISGPAFCWLAGICMSWLFNKGWYGGKIVW